MPLIIQAASDSAAYQAVGIDDASPQDKLCISTPNGLKCDDPNDPGFLQYLTTGEAKDIDMLDLEKSSTDAAGAARERLDSIFQKAIKLYTWDSGTKCQTPGCDWIANMSQILSGQSATGSLGQYVSGVVPTAGTLSGFTAGKAKATPTPPKVASVGECGNAGCKESKEGQINVDGLEAGTIQGADGQKSVNVSFFAWADGDQMPLRRVLMDWGDGYLDSPVADRNRTNVWPTNSQTGSTSDDNFYKNRRGLDVDGKKICGNTTAHDSFGYSEQACESGYVNFTHDYVCSGTVQKNLPACRVDNATGRLLNAPCTGTVPNGDGKCVYQPRAQVVDNWGWCTGTCTSSQSGDGTNMCFGSECNTNYPKPDTSESAASNPWVYYSGYIIVEPSK